MEMIEFVYCKKIRTTKRTETLRLSNEYFAQHLKNYVTATPTAFRKNFEIK